MIGVGGWGKDVAHELSAVSELVYFASKENNAEVPNAKRATVEEICADPTVEAVAIATPIATHAEIVRKVLESGKHVLCEKPLAENSKDAYALVELAGEKNLILATDYIFLYHPAYRELKIRARGKTITRVACVWRGYGTFDESIEMNSLAYHLSLAYDLLGMPETASIVRREGSEAAGDNIETTLTYPSGIFISDIDRLSQEKMHTTTVTFESGEILTWDGTRLTRGEELILESTDAPLQKEIGEFLDAVKGGPLPPTAGDFGARVLEIHEMLQK
ncbi:hypothetical protein A3C18_01405 [Candidatus Kaiserbacteria bacterium RIFCSPHIGHO2_02_FULL_54_11b]|nr:MAG: hypothetical protein A3C18_01405 [Candidatus Kaiserbacteria bacterium RIFCSPHIGHO2_02_FULL_54_11b]